MPRYTPLRVEQIQPQMIAHLVTRAGMTDVSDTSVVKHLLAAFARQLDQFYYQASLLRNTFSLDTATGIDLDERAQEIQPSTLTRMAATRAVGLVVFSRTTTTGSISIPTGTQIKTAGGAIFNTTAVGTIAAANAAIIAGHTTGQDSGYVPVTAATAGSAGNVVANTLIKFVQKPTGVTSVTNPAACAQGQDLETDDAFRQRLKNYIGSLARSTVQALQSSVLGAQDPNTGATVLYASVVEDPVNPGYVTVYIDDGTGSAETVVSVTGEVMTQGLAGPPPNTATGGETRLTTNNKPLNTDDAFTLVSNTRGTLSTSVYTLDPAAGLVVFSPALVAAESITVAYTYYTGLIALAQKIVDGDPSDPVDYPGVRAAGIQVIVQTPTIVTIFVNATLTIADGYDAGTVRAAAVQSILGYVNGLGISNEVFVSGITQAVMNTAGVVNVVLNAPTTDTSILSYQLARTNVGDITVA